MASLREAYLRVVDQRDVETILFAPLTDTMFGASFAGKAWLSEATLEDQVAAAEACGYAAGFVRGSTPDLTVNPVLTGLVETERVHADETGRRYTQIIRTPRGDLSRNLVEQPQRGITAVGEWVESAEQLPAACWIAEEVLSGRRDALIVDTYRAYADAVRPHGVSLIQLELPYFMFGLPGFSAGPLMLVLDEESGYARAMELAAETLQHTAGLLIEAGIDFIWMGAGGTELLSPTVWEDIVIPQSKALSSCVHGRGGRIHFHCCGQSKLWTEKGYFNQIGIDVLETLSAPPSGTIDDLGAARRAIDAAVVTRGNIDLGLIRTGTVDACCDAVRAVVEATRGFPHLVGAGDAILYGTPPENLRAMADLCLSLRA